ncbi:hypothetical protein Tco_1458528 [Tanacetum coccineum]
MPTAGKTYDGAGDLEDHLKTLTTATKVERWAMPTWCPMFNSTLLGSARYTRDPVELHHVKQREGESTEAFMERFTSESLMFKGAPKLMIISGFMHSITHPGLIKSLNDNIPKMMDELMSVTKAFIRREKAATSHFKRKGQSWKQS